MINYALALGTLLTMDAIWLRGIAFEHYKKKLGARLGDTQWWAVAGFYLTYACAINGLTLHPDPMVAAKRGAMLGAASYGAWNFTNSAILKDWPSEITLMDLAWGTGMTASTAALVSYLRRDSLALEAQPPVPAL